MTEEPNDIDKPMKKTFAPMWRRLLAILYDSFLVIALWMVGTLLLLPITEGDAISPGNMFYQVYLLGIWFAFLSYCWCQKKRTPGMLAWRLIIENKEGTTVTFSQAVLRFALVISSITVFAIGLFWALFDKEKQTLYDRLSKTQLVVV